jgi:hypothetical protein
VGIRVAISVWPPWSGRRFLPGEAIELVIPDEKREEVSYCFHIVYNAPLNKSNQDRLVTFVEYWEDDPKKKKNTAFQLDYRFGPQAGAVTRVTRKDRTVISKSRILA